MAANVGTDGVCLTIASLICAVTDTSNDGTEGVWVNHRELVESHEYNFRP